MPSPMSAADVLNREWLNLRKYLIDLAATLDRIGRGDGSVADDPRMLQIRQALETLTKEQSDRAATVETVFSLPYDANWREAYEL